MLSVRGTIRIFLTGLLVFIAGTGKLFAQQQHNLPRLFFDHITIQNGLSSNKVICVYRDTRGFLWIGTHNGLNEYDGRNIIVLHHNRFDPHSIINNSITSICEDGSGYLWIGTGNGISRLNPFDDLCINYLHDPKNPFSLNDNQNCYVYIDKKGTIWIGNESGLSYLDKKSKHFIHVQILPDSSNKRTLTAVGHFLEDRDGRFWLGTHSGLVLYDRKKNKFNFFFPGSDTKKAGHSVTALFQDHAGRIWTSIWGEGLSEFDPNTHTFSSSYIWNHKNQFTSSVNLVFSISETKSSDGHYTLWGATSEGLMKIDSLPASDRTISWFTFNPADPHSISDNELQCMLTDNQGILWIGTNNGLDEYAPRNQLFSNVIPVKGDISKILVDTFHNSLHYFVATWYGNGLTEFDRHFKIIRFWQRIPSGTKEVNNGQVSDVIRAKNGLLWIATFNGLYSYSENNLHFTEYKHLSDNQLSLVSNKTTSVAEDNAGRVWIGTYGKGLDVFDPVKKIFIHYHHDTVNPNSLCNDLVWNIYKDKYGRIWIATDRGLSLWDEGRQYFINYTDNEKDARSIKGRSISGISCDGDSIVWVSTSKGLNYLNLRTGRSMLFAEEEGLNSNNIYGIIKDNNDLLWLCTDAGISNFNAQNNTFVNYGGQSGLPESIDGSFAIEPDGKILAGGENKLLQFDPSAFTKTSLPAPVYLTEITVGGYPVIFHHAKNKMETITLHYPLNNFSISFTSPEFYNGRGVKYAYYLEGADAHWIKAGARNFVSYAGLEPGNYILHLKAANSEGIWDKADTQLHITVLPPFWKTWWFRFAVLLMIVLLVYSIFIYRVTSIRKQEAMKTAINKQMADMRLKTLRSRMNPHFMFNALNSIQECIYTGKSNAAYKYLSKFSHLVRMILERSEQTFITVSQEIEMLKLYLELESLRFQQSFIYSINQDEIEADFLKIPPMLIQPFVENAIWHGLLHKEGEKKLSIIFRADDNFVNVIIEDNGIGRDAARKLKMKTLEEQQSLGLRLVSEQLETVSKMSNKVADMKVEDIFSTASLTGKQLPSGTRVTLFIPIMSEKS